MAEVHQGKTPAPRSHQLLAPRPKGLALTPLCPPQVECEVTQEIVRNGMWEEERVDGSGEAQGSARRTCWPEPAHMAPAPRVPFPSIDPCFALLSLTFISFSTLVSCIMPLITVSHLASVLVHRNSVFTIPKTSWPDIVPQVRLPRSCWPCRIVLLKGSQCSPQIICDIWPSSWCSLYLL